MGKIYARTILRGPRKLSDVPQTWFAATVEALQEMCEPELFAQLLDEAKAETE